MLFWMFSFRILKDDQRMLISHILWYWMMFFNYSAIKFHLLQFWVCVSIPIFICMPFFVFSFGVGNEHKIVIQSLFPHYFNILVIFQGVEQHITIIERLPYSILQVPFKILIRFDYVYVFSPSPTPWQSHLNSNLDSFSSSRMFLGQQITFLKSYFFVYNGACRSVI